MEAFEKYAERIKLDDLESVARRQMWPAMVKRIQAVFDEIEHSPLAGCFGSFYLHPVVPDAYRKLPEGRYLAQLQLTCGIRRLGLDTLKKSETHPQASPLLSSKKTLQCGSTNLLRELSRFSWRRIAQQC
ncbi:hypothetical protein [Pseudomonas sp. URIL14HWK12:I6]|uniref:hypothetical protein n=1 Tax=Pseudomonas sp. URIL14HWK12:I6 TaxID=1283293 RepID=UPI0006762051|nr:hypothetical protein [Pseudomonas sp. URIL14HWK12:I6]